MAKLKMIGDKTKSKDDLKKKKDTEIVLELFRNMTPKDAPNFAGKKNALEELTIAVMAIVQRCEL